MGLTVEAWIMYASCVHYAAHAQYVLFAQETATRC